MLLSNVLLPNLEPIRVSAGDVFHPTGQNCCLAAHFCNNSGSHDIFDKETPVLHPSVSRAWPVSLWQASSHNARSHSRPRSLITDPVPNLSLLKSLKTLQMQSNMILRLISETFRGSRQMTHAFPLCDSICSVAAFVILADKVPRMHISAYLYIPHFFFHGRGRSVTSI